MLRWAVKLSQLEIEYEPRTPVKGQALAEFIQEGTKIQEERAWTLHVDGSSAAGKSGACVMLTNLEEKESEFAIQAKNHLKNVHKYL